MSVRVDAERLSARLRDLARIGRTSQGGTTRLSYTADHAAAVRTVAEWMREAGAEVGLDAWGNLVGVIPGSGESAAPLAAGSHLDTVPNGGMFDGALGVVGALEAACALREARRRLRHPLVLVGFAEEEGTSFGLGCLGALGALGRVPSPETLRDPLGRTIAERLREFCRDLPRREFPTSPACFLELHIEQGPVLAERRIPLGTVDVIVGIARVAVSFLGEANHAGTTPMASRRDALWGAADLVGQVRGLALRTGGRAVATVGRCVVSPGATNVVPGRVDVTVELRSPSLPLLAELRSAVDEAARASAERYGLAVELGPWRDEPPVALCASIRDRIAAAAAEAGWPVLTMPSWAGHDAKILARAAPTGMIFVPSAGGISHSPRESTSLEDAARGTQVLCRTLELLDQEIP